MPAFDYKSELPKAFTSKPLQIFLILSVVLAGIFFIGKAFGKSTAYAAAPLPNNGTGIPNNWEPQMRKIVSDLFNVMDGVFTWAVEKEKVFVQLMPLTDDQLTAVYNEFNRLHEAKGKGTLTQWMRDESNVTLNSKRDEIVRRMTTLNLN